MGGEKGHEMTHMEMEGHGDMTHGGMAHGGTAHGGASQEGAPHAGAGHIHMAHDGAPHGGMAHSEMAHGGMDHMDMGGMGHMGNLKLRFWVCLALAVPVVLLSPMMGVRLPFQLSFPGSAWVVLALCCGLYFYGGKPFLLGARDELRQRAPAMMTLISLGITVAFGYSLYAFVMNELVHTGGHVMDFFWELATLIVIMLLGHWIEMRAMAGAGNALKSMAKLLPAEARVVGPDGAVAAVPLAQLQTGQTVLVGAGEKIPADGVITEGRTAVDEALVTGEARQVEKAAGDAVIGGSLNGSGTVQVRVTATGEAGYVAQVSKLIVEAQRAKSRSETLADRVARWLFYVAVAAGVIALVVWLAVTGDFNTALARMVTVLVIACPHALGLAIPLVTARSTSLGAARGLLVRNRQAIEGAERLDTVMMDKTGTLTEGRFELRAVRAFGAGQEEEVLALAAALEQGSSHPLAAGILRAAQQRGLALPKTAEAKAIPGAGMEGALADGRRLVLASVAYLLEKGVDVDRAALEDMAKEGYTLSVLAVDGRAAGALAQGDEIKPGAAEAVKRMKALGINPVMLTGDSEKAAEAVAAKLGIEDRRAGLRPEDKAKLVQQARAEGRTVMMVGDGVNDAPALAAADIGVAIGAGTDVAMDSADVVLVRSDPADILDFITLARATRRKMKQNLWWGAGYNIVAIPLAAGVLAPVGILLSPAVGAVLMSLSTVIVAVNALTLRLPKRD